MILSIDLSLYMHVRNATSPKDLWDTLKNFFAENGVTRKIGLLRPLISLRLENCESMQSYINQVIETSQSRSGFKISDEWVGSLLLAGLPEKFGPMIMAIENQKESAMKIFRSDNGGEFCASVFENFLESNGIVHQKTNAYTPEQNGVSERMNRTLVEKARCLMFDAKLSKQFWAEAINTAAYLRNRLVVTGLNNKTPYEIWHGRKPDVSNIRIFGSEVMVHIPKEKRQKIDKKAQKMLLVGYGTNVKGYRLYDPVKRDVIINEKPILAKDLNFADDMSVLDEEPVNKTEESLAQWGIMMGIHLWKAAAEMKHLMTQKTQILYLET